MCVMLIEGNGYYFHMFKLTKYPTTHIISWPVKFNGRFSAAYQ